MPYARPDHIARFPARPTGQWECALKATGREADKKESRG